MKITKDYLISISNCYQRIAQMGELSLLSHDSIISLEEIQFALSVLLDLKVGQVVLTNGRLWEYLDDMIDICVTAFRNDLVKEAASSLVKEKYNIKIITNSNESLINADIRRWTRQVAPRLS